MENISPVPARRFPRRFWLHTLLVVLLWPALMIFPYPPEGFLDASWQVTLIEAHVRGWQFGRDLIFTWGPWGFLHSIFHFGDAAAATRLTWELLGKLLLAAGLVAGTRHLSALRQIILIAVCMVFIPVFQDTAYLLFITVAVLAVLLRPGADRAEWGAFVVGLAFLAQIKFTYALLAASGIGLAWLLRLYQRRWLDAALLGGGFALFFVVWWCAAGQNPDNIVPYLRRSWEISANYPAAMGVDGEPSVLRWGVVVLLCHGFFVWRLWRTHADRAFAGAGALFLGAAWYLVWKHGFTRADGHVMGFFLYGLPVSLLVAALSFPERRHHWLDLALIPCLAGLWSFDPALLGQLPGKTWATLQSNTRAALHVTTLIPSWRQQLATARTTNALPAIQRAVGTASVDLYNYEQAALLLNGLNFRPRPVFQSYSAYTPGLAERNASYYRSPRAPDFLVWHHSSIDERFPTQDDAPFFAELPGTYREVLSEGDFLLLKKIRPFAATPRARTLVHHHIAPLGEKIAVPASTGSALWVQIFPHASLLGRLRAFLYKPTELRLTVEETSGRTTVWRLLPRVSASGFLLNPFLETQADFRAYLHGDGLKEIKSLRFDAVDGDREYWTSTEIFFHALRDIRVNQYLLHQQLVDAGVTNTAPSALLGDNPWEIFALPSGQQAVLAHVPASLEFAPAPGTRRLTGQFGIREGAYTGGNRTDGVEFVVEATGADQRPTVLWRRTLNPAQNPADGGPQTFSVELPADLPARLALRTLPGPADDNRWDWSYWTQLKFTP